MAPKRIADAESSQSPKKRAKKTSTSSQRNIESFFSSKGDGTKNHAFMRREESPQTTHSRPSSPSKVSTEVILIDDSDGDGDDGSGHYHTALAAPITNRASEAANPAQSGAVHPAPDVGIASSPETPEMELDSQTAQPITKQPGGPRILNSIEHVTGGERIPSITSDMSEIPPHQQATTQKKPRGRTLDSSSELAAILPFPDLAADPLLFGPRVELDHPPWWPEGTPAPFALLVHALQALTSTRSRIAILSIVTNLLRILIAHDPLSVLPALYLLSNSLSPPWEGIELGAGGSVISKALQNTTSITPATMRALYKQYGDPGDVAYYAVVGNTSAPRTSVLRPHPPLLIQALYQDLQKIASARGKGSQKLRQGTIEKLMLSAVGSSWRSGTSRSYTDVNPHLFGEEARYLVRILVHNLRVGAVRTTILCALARAITLTLPRGSTAVDDGSSSITPADLDLVKGVLQILEQAKVTRSRKGQSDVTKGQSEQFTGAYERIQGALKAAESILRRAFAQHPSYDDIATVLLGEGIQGLLSPSSIAGLTLGTPLLPTLGSPMRSLEEIYELLGPQTSWCAERKYDGQRAQVHAWRQGENIHVRIFSRHLENMTDKYPDLVHLITNTMQGDSTLKSFIVDAEAVAVDPLTGDLRSFQELAGRARKDVQISDIKVAVCLYLFDIMLLNGTVLIQKPFRERRRLLHTHLPPTKSISADGDGDRPIKHIRATLDHVESIDARKGREAVQEFWERAVDSKCEGLMIKLLDDTVVVVDDVGEVGNDENLGLDTSPLRSSKLGSKKPRRKALPATYEPDKRTAAWLKLKKDYVDGIGDSLDLVPVGAWHGNGRKAAWWSPILLAVYDSERDIFVAMCKCMSGFTDVFYKQLNERYPVDSDTCSMTPRWQVETGGYQPSVYFRPSEVWEIRGADLTISPTSVTALGLLPQAREKGLSLRFPRFIRVRDDKGIEMASTPGFVYQLWKKQESKGGTHGEADEGDLLDYIEEEIMEDEYESDRGPT